MPALGQELEAPMVAANGASTYVFSLAVDATMERVFSPEFERYVTRLLTEAIRHPGTAILEVLQPCPTYNDLYTRDWYSGTDPETGLPRLYDVAEQAHQPLIPPGAVGDEAAAVRAACQARLVERNGRIPLGLFLQDRSRPAATGAANPPGGALADAAGKSLTELAPLLSRLRIG